MELLVIRLLLSTTALIASASSYQSKPSYVIPNISKGEFFLNGLLNGNKLYFKEHCNCTIDETSHDYFLVNCSSSAGIPDCPRDTILVELSSARDYQLPKTICGNTKSVTTTTTECPSIFEISSDAHVEHSLIWFIIVVSQFVVIIVLLLHKLWQRLRSALKQRTSSSTTQGSFGDPTPRPAVQQPPLPSEAGYEIPIVPHAVMRKVHEGNKSDKNDTPTTEHYTYDSILDETVDTNKIYYSITNI